MSLLYQVARRVSQILRPDSRLDRAVRPWTERLIGWAVGRRGLAWNINGTPCRIDPRFRAQFAQGYEFELAGYLRGKVRPGQTCLDVGANIGAWVIQFAHLVGPAGRVVAFEPNPGARAVLHEHIRLNHLDAVTRVVPAAVGGAAGEVTFYAAGFNGMSRIGEPNRFQTNQTAPIAVPVVTLDGWCQENCVSPDWLLLDIEGFEGDALLGAADLIRARGPALGIIVEMHPDLWPSSGTSRNEIAARIAALGRRPVSLTGQADPLEGYGLVVLEPV